MSTEYDLILIGAGAGGMSAARTAARRGARPLPVQAGPIGGECTFTGCVPSKALIAAAAAGKAFEDAMAGVRRSIETIAATEDDVVSAREGIDVVHGRATFRSSRELDVDGRRVRARRFVIATGTHPAIPPIDDLEGVDYVTNEDVFDIGAQPASMILLGGGAIGCERGQAFAHLGTKVVTVEALDRLLPREEPESSAAVAEVFADGGRPQRSS